MLQCCMKNSAFGYHSFLSTCRQFNSITIPKPGRAMMQWLMKMCISSDILLIYVWFHVVIYQITLSANILLTNIE